MHQHLGPHLVGTSVFFLFLVYVKQNVPDFTPDTVRNPFVHTIDHFFSVLGLWFKVLFFFFDHLGPF